jgi:hypothetical protein
MENKLYFIIFFPKNLIMNKFYYYLALIRILCKIILIIYFFLYKLYLKLFSYIKN